MEENFQDELKNKSLTTCSEGALKYSVNSSIGSAIAKADKIEKKTKWSDRVTCDVCGGEFIRSARSNHKKTKFHLLHEQMNKKIKNVLLN